MSIPGCGQERASALREPPVHEKAAQSEVVCQVPSGEITCPPDFADGGHNFTAQKPCSKHQWFPSPTGATTERGLLAGHTQVAGIQNRPSRAPCPARLNLPGDWHELRNPTTSSKIVYWETLRSHIAQTLAFPINSLSEGSSSNSSRVRSSHRPSPTR